MMERCLCSLGTLCQGSSVVHPRLACPFAHEDNPCFPPQNPRLEQRGFVHSGLWSHYEGPESFSMLCSQTFQLFLSFPNYWNYPGNPGRLGQKFGGRFSRRKKLYWMLWPAFAALAGAGLVFTFIIAFLEGWACAPHLSVRGNVSLSSFYSVQKQSQRKGGRCSHHS